MLPSAHFRRFSHRSQWFHDLFQKIRATSSGHSCFSSAHEKLSAGQAWIICSFTFNLRQRKLRKKKLSTDAYRYTCIRRSCTKPFHSLVISLPITSNVVFPFANSDFITDFTEAVTSQLRSIIERLWSHSLRIFNTEVSCYSSRCLRFVYTCA